jgi:formylglycine-generating enzyme required for sulfatase activity
MNRYTILFLAANPSDSQPLKLDEEIRRIDHNIRLAEFRDMFEIRQHWAVRADDIQELFLRHKPHIVHYSGHGSKSSEIILQDDSGDSHPVSPEALSDLFEILRDNIRCVVLNACYSEKQALAIANNIECVVGMSRAISDEAALDFASAFYRALGYGEDVKKAFDLGCNQINMKGIDEQDTPKLLALNTNPSEIFFQAMPEQEPMGPNIINSKSELKVTPPSIESISTIPFDWVTIQAGEFWMGSARNQDPDARNFVNEERHSVYLPEYRIAKVPVTVDQFQRFINSTRYKTTAEKVGWARDLAKGLKRDDWPPKQGAYWEHPHGPDSNVQEDHPVTCISWYDAVEFCKWAGVRLPTEAEWEKAAGWDPENEVKYIYPWSNDPPDKNRCNFDMQVGDTTSVYRYPPAANGLFDMAGNVWEWTSSLYKQYPYEADDRENLEATGERVLRGGSFYQKAKYVRCTYRNRHRPDAKVSDYGFRVCAVKLAE